MLQNIKLHVTNQNYMLQNIELHVTKMSNYVHVTKYQIKIQITLQNINLYKY